MDLPVYCLSLNIYLDISIPSICCCTAWTQVLYPCIQLWFLPCKRKWLWQNLSFCMHHCQHYWNPLLFLQQGPTYYNSIENDIKESNSLHLFQTKLKKQIIICELLDINLVVNSYISSHVWYYFYTYCYMYHTLYFVNSVYVIS